MIQINLPNGKTIDYQKPVTPIYVANEISTSLAKEALVASVNGNLWDLEREIEETCDLKILTILLKNRHSYPIIKKF